MARGAPAKRVRRRAGGKFRGWPEGEDAPVLEPSGRERREEEEGSLASLPSLNLPHADSGGGVNGEEAFSHSESEADREGLAERSVALSTGRGRRRRSSFALNG